MERFNGRFDSVFDFHLLGDRLGSLPHLLGEAKLDCLTEIFTGEFLEGNGLWSCTSRSHHVAPELLISKEGDHNSGTPVEKAAGGSARSSMVYDH